MIYYVSGNQSNLHAGQLDLLWWPYNCDQLCVCWHFHTIPSTRKGHGFLAGWYYLILILMNWLSDTHEFQSRDFSSTWLKRWSKSAKLATEVSATLRATASNSCNLGNRHSRVSASHWPVVDGKQMQWTGLCKAFKCCWKISVFLATYHNMSSSIFNCLTTPNSHFMYLYVLYVEVTVALSF